jgi:hypothetical protein
MHPWSFESRVFNFLRTPSSFVFGIGNFGGFPFTIKIIIPIFRFLCIRINNFSSNIIPSSGFNILRIINVFIINPIGGFTLGRIVNFLGRKNIPEIWDRSTLLFSSININFESIVWA